MADTAELLKRLEEGVQQVMSSEGWRRFLATQAKFHNYSSGNVLLIMVQSPQATQVAGFHTWLDLGRHVRKGEKGIAILAPVFPKREQPEPGALPKDDEPVRFRVAHVFDMAQTDGPPLPEPPVHKLRGDSAEARLLFARLTQYAVENGLRIDAADPKNMPRGANGYYQPATHHIVLAKGLAPDQRVKTLVHEIAHHMLEHGRGRAPGRPTEEAEAEGVAFVVCSKYGLDTSDYSFGYVAAWSKDEGGPALVKQASTAIQGVARDLIDRMEPQPVRAATHETVALER